MEMVCPCPVSRPPLPFLESPANHNNHFYNKYQRKIEELETDTLSLLLKWLSTQAHHTHILMEEIGIKQNTNSDNNNNSNSAHIPNDCETAANSILEYNAMMCALLQCKRTRIEKLQNKYLYRIRIDLPFQETQNNPKNTIMVINNDDNCNEPLIIIAQHEEEKGEEEEEEEAYNDEQIHYTDPDLTESESESEAELNSNTVAEESESEEISNAIGNENAVKSDIIDANVTTDANDIVNTANYHVCQYANCKKHYRRSSSLYNHVQRVHLKVRHYECETCAKSFYAKTELKVHIRHHTGEKPFKCRWCSAKFAKKGNLNRHLRTHTGEKPFKCKYCATKFTQRVTLRQHIRTHTGEKPFKCEYCGSRFAQTSNLKMHIRRRHTGERPFKCGLCVSKFAAKSDLTNHMRKHTGEKPFKCEYCVTAFAQRSTLKRHTVAKHLLK